MKYSTELLSAALLCAHSVRAQSGGPHGGVPFPKLGWNHQPVDKDDEAIAENFQDVDIDLLSPAFLDPKSIRDGFDNGTSNPTSHKDMGALLLRIISSEGALQLTHSQTSSSRTWPSAMTG